MAGPHRGPPARPAGDGVDIGGVGPRARELQRERARESEREREREREREKMERRRGTDERKRVCVSSYEVL